MDFADQLADRFVGDAAQHIENGEFDCRQRSANRNSVVPEIESENENFLQQEVEVSRVLADEKWLQVVKEDRIKRLHYAVPHRHSLRTVARAHAAKKIVLVPQQFQRLYNDRGAEEFPLQHRLAEDLVQPAVPRIRICGFRPSSGRARGRCRHRRSHPAEETCGKKLATGSSGVFHDKKRVDGIRVRESPSTFLQTLSIPLIRKYWYEVCARRS